MDFGIASYAGITIIAFLIGYFWKTADKAPDKWIPCVCGISGCILGIVAFLIKVPDFPANDILNAAAVGIASGFAATGIHQLYKQFTKKDDEGAEQVAGIVVNDPAEEDPEEIVSEETKELKDDSSEN